MAQFLLVLSHRPFRSNPYPPPPPPWPADQRLKPTNLLALTKFEKEMEFLFPGKILISKFVL